MPTRRRVPSSPAKCFCNSCTLLPLLYLVFLEKNNLFCLEHILAGVPGRSPMQWLQHHSLTEDRSLCGVKLYGKCRAPAREKAGSCSQEEFRDQGKRKLGVKTSFSGLQCSPKGCHTLCEGGRQCILQLQADAALNWRVSDQMCEYVSSLRFFLPKKSAAEICGAAAAPSTCWCRRQGSPRSVSSPGRISASGTISRLPVFFFLVKSLKMIVSSILASAPLPDHNFIVKTIPVLSHVLPLGFIFSQSGMTSAFKQHPLSSCLFSWQIFRIWKMSMTGEVKRGKNPFHLKFFNIFSKSPCTGSRNTSMHYQIAEAWLGAEDMIIKNLMTIKSQENCRENFSHKCFTFTLFIQIQRN